MDLDSGARVSFVSLMLYCYIKKLESHQAMAEKFFLVIVYITYQVFLDHVW